MEVFTFDNNSVWVDPPAPLLAVEESFNTKRDYVAQCLYESVCLFACSFVVTIPITFSLTCQIHSPM